MNKIDYDVLSDADKLDLLRVLYHDIKNRTDDWAKAQRELIYAETRLVYGRIKENLQ